MQFEVKLMILIYLNRLKHWMWHRAFPPDDRLVDAVVQTEYAMHQLQVEVHYLSCGDVVMRRTNSPSQASAASEEAQLAKGGTLGI